MNTSTYMEEAASYHQLTFHIVISAQHCKRQLIGVASTKFTPKFIIQYLTKCSSSSFWCLLFYRFLVSKQTPYAKISTDGKMQVSTQCYRI